MGLLLFYIKTFEQKLYKSHEGLRLIYVGGITHRKGLHHLLKVISELEKDNISLSIAGDVNAEMKIYQKYKNSSNIKFLGFLTHDKLKEEYIKQAERARKDNAQVQQQERTRKT